MRTRNFAVPLFLLAAAIAPPGAGAQQSGIPVGSQIPDVQLTALDGTATDLSTVVAGKPAIIEFWATWCPLCRALEPQFAEITKDHGAALQVVRIGVHDNQSAEQQQEYVTKHEIGGLHFFDTDGAAVRAFTVPHTSYVVVIDASGKVVYTGQGKDQVLADAIAPVLGHE